MYPWRYLLVLLPWKATAFIEPQLLATALKSPRYERGNGYSYTPGHGVTSTYEGIGVCRPVIGRDGRQLRCFSYSVEESPDCSMDETNSSVEEEETRTESLAPELLELERPVTEGDVDRNASHVAILRNYAKRGLWEEAIQLLSDIHSFHREALTVECYQLALQTCRKAKKWMPAKRLLNEMKDHGLHPNVACYTIVMDTCGQAGRVEECVALLEEMKSDNEGQDTAPNVITYAAALRSAMITASWKSSMIIWQDMIDSFIRPDEVCYNVLLQTLRKSKEYASLPKYLEEITSLGYDQYMPCLISIAKIYQDTGDWRSQKDIINHLSTHEDTAMTSLFRITFETMITHEAEDALRELIVHTIRTRERHSAMAQSCIKAAMTVFSLYKKWRDVETTFLLIKEEGFATTADLYNLAIHAMCSNASSESATLAVRTAKEAHDQGILLSESSYYALMNAYVSSDHPRRPRWERSINFVRDFYEEFPMAETLSPIKIAMKAFARVGRHMEAMDLLQSSTHRLQAHLEMGRGCDRSEGIVRVIFNYAMISCVKGNQWKKSIEILDIMTSLGLMPDQNTYTNLMLAYSSASNWQKVIDCFEDMKHNNLPRKAIDYSMAIKACERMGDWQRALALLKDMNQLGGASPGETPDAATYTVVMKACGKAGKYREALSVLYEMQRQGVQPDQWAYASIIKALGKAEMWEKILDILEEMEKQGIEPDAQSYYPAIKACLAAKQWDVAIGLFENLIQFDATMSLSLYHSVLQACAGSGRFEIALQILEDMKEDGFQPSERTYALVLKACKRARQWLAVSAVFEEILASPDVMANQSIYELTLEAAVEAGRWDFAISLLKEMYIERQLRPSKKAYKVLRDHSSSADKETIRSALLILRDSLKR